VLAHSLICTYGNTAVVPQFCLRVYITLAQHCMSILGKSNKTGSARVLLQFYFESLPFHNSTTKRKREVYSGV